jgi:MFS family permease
MSGVLISLNLFGMGWRAVFLINLPVAILVMLFGIPLLKETRDTLANWTQAAWDYRCSRWLYCKRLAIPS